MPRWGPSGFRCKPVARRYARNAPALDEADIVKDRPATARRTIGFQGTPQEDIVPDWPKKPGKRWKYVRPEKPRPRLKDWQGRGYTPQEMFPEWDWDAHPLGPSLDDPVVSAYCEDSWGTFLRE